MQGRLGLPYAMVPRARLREEMATDLYDGGGVIPDLGSLHPGSLSLRPETRALGMPALRLRQVRVTAVELAASQVEVSAAASLRSRSPLATGGKTSGSFKPSFRDVTNLLAAG